MDNKAPDVSVLVIFVCILQIVRDIHARFVG